MTMRFRPAVAITTTDADLKMLFEFLDFMRQPSPTGPGWTVPRSSDGTTGGDGDNIADFNDLGQGTVGVSESWFVLRSPGGEKEFMFWRETATDNQWSCLYSPGALFVGGDETNEASAADSVNWFNGTFLMTSTGDTQQHMGADDAAPYGFFVYGHATGIFATGRWGMALVPITDGVQPGDEVDPFVYVHSAQNNPFLFINLTRSIFSAAQARVVGIVPGEVQETNIPALKMVDDSALPAFPNGLPVDSAGNDLSIAVSFGRRAALAARPGFKGFSDFMQWNGFTRAVGETFASRTRISLGDVNFPWDGSVPLDS